MQSSRRLEHPLEAALMNVVPLCYDFVLKRTWIGTASSRMVWWNIFQSWIPYMIGSENSGRKPDVRTRAEFIAPPLGLL